MFKNIFFALSLIFLASACSNAPSKKAYDNSMLPNIEPKYKIPKDWRREEPSNSFRKEQYRLPGDIEYAIYTFPGMQSSVEANISRWKKQFVMDSDPNIEQYNLGKMPITKVFISGTYLKKLMPMMPSSPVTKHEDYAMHATIVETQKGPWFFKALGPKEALTKAMQDPLEL